MGTNIVNAGDSQLTNYAGHIFDWKIVGGATGGTLALAEVRGWQGGEPPLHVHALEDEFFYVLEGDVTFRIGDETKRALPGSLVWAPRGVPHGFAFETPTVRLLIGFSPAGQEDVFLRFSTAAAAGDLPGEPSHDPDFAEIEAADKAAGVTYLGPPLRELLASEASAS